jgi:hypothetical protein
MLKRDLKEMEFGGVGWVRLAQNRVQWWALVIMMMNLRFQALMAASVKMTGLWNISLCTVSFIHYIIIS